MPEENQRDNQPGTTTLFDAINNTNNYISFINLELNNPNISADIKLDLAVQRSWLAMLQVRQYQMLPYIYNFSVGYTELAKLSPEYINLLHNSLLENTLHAQRNNIQKIYCIFLIGRELLMAKCIDDMQAMVTIGPFESITFDNLLLRAHHINILLQTDQDELYENRIHMCNFFMIALDSGYYGILQELISRGVRFSGEEAMMIHNKLLYMRAYIGETLYIDLLRIIDDEPDSQPMALIDIQMYLAYQPTPTLLIKDKERRKNTLTILEPASEIILLDNIESVENTTSITQMQPTHTEEEEEEQEQEEELPGSQTPKKKKKRNKKKNKTLSTSVSNCEDTIHHTTQTSHMSEKQDEQELAVKLKQAIESFNSSLFNVLVTENEKLQLQATEPLLKNLLDLGLTRSHTQVELNSKVNVDSEAKPYSTSSQLLSTGNRNVDQHRAEQIKVRLRAKIDKKHAVAEKARLFQEQEKIVKTQGARQKQLTACIQFLEAANLSWYNLLLIIMYNNIIPCIRNAALRKILMLNTLELHFARHFCEFDKSYKLLCQDKQEEDELGESIREKMQELDIWKIDNPRQCLDPNTSLYNFFASKIDIFYQQFIAAFPAYSNGLIPKEILEGSQIGIIYFAISDSKENFMHILARNCPSENMLVFLLKHIKANDPNGIITSTLLPRDEQGCTVITILETKENGPWCEAINSIYDMFLCYIKRIALIDAKNSALKKDNTCTLQTLFQDRQDIFANHLERNAIKLLLEQQRYFEVIMAIDIRQNFRKYLQELLQKFPPSISGLYQKYLNQLFGGNEYVTIRDRVPFLATFILAVKDNPAVQERLARNTTFRSAIAELSPVEVPMFQKLPLLAENCVKEGKKVPLSQIEELHRQMQAYKADINLPTAQGERYLELCVQSGDKTLVEYLCNKMGAEINIRSIFIALSVTDCSIFAFLWQRYMSLYNKNPQNMLNPAEWSYGEVDLIYQAVAHSKDTSALQSLIQINAALDKLYPSRQNIFNIACLRLALATTEEKTHCLALLCLLLEQFSGNKNQLAEMLQARNSFGFSAIDFVSTVSQLPNDISDKIKKYKDLQGANKLPQETLEFISACDSGGINVKTIIERAVARFDNIMYFEVMQAYPQHRALAENKILEHTSSCTSEKLANNRRFFLHTKLSYLLAVRLLLLPHLPAQVKGCILENVRLNYSNYEFAMFMLHVDLDAMIDERRETIQTQRDLSAKGFASVEGKLTKGYSSEPQSEEEQLLAKIKARIESVNSCTLTHQQIYKSIEECFAKFTNGQEYTVADFNELMQYANYSNPNGTTFLSIAFRNRELPPGLYKKFIEANPCDIRKVDFRGMSILQNLASNFHIYTAPILSLLWDRIIDFQTMLPLQGDISRLKLTTALRTDYFGNSWLYTLFADPEQSTDLLLETLNQLEKQSHTAHMLLLSIFIPNKLGFTPWYKLEIKNNPKWQTIKSFMIGIIPSLALEVTTYLPELQKHNSHNFPFFTPINSTSYPCSTDEDAHHLIQILRMRCQIRKELARIMEQSEINPDCISWLKSFFSGQELTQTINGKTLFDHLKKKFVDNKEVHIILEQLLQLQIEIQEKFSFTEEINSSKHRYGL